MSCYASGVLTGASIDLGYESTEVTPVVECLPIAGAVGSIGIGTRHLIAYLASLMMKDSQLMAQLENLQPTTSEAVQVVNSAEAVSSTSPSASSSTPKNFGIGISREKLLLEFVETLLRAGQMRAPTPEESGAAAAASRAQEEEEEVFDVAAALVAGKEKAYVEEQERKKKEAAEAAASSSGKKKGGKDAPTETVVTFRSSKIKVTNKLLNRLTEPLFKPSLLDEIVGSFGIGRPSESVLFAARDVSSVDSSNSTQEETSPTDLPISIQVLGPCGAYPLQHLSSIPSSYSLLPTLPFLISQSLLSNHLPTPSTSPILFDSLLPHGALLKLSGMVPLLLSSLSDYLAEAPENGNNGHGSALAALAATREENLMNNEGEEETLMNLKQPTNSRVLKTPDWFPEFKDRSDVAPFLGATIYGRVSCATTYQTFSEQIALMISVLYVSLYFLELSGLSSRTPDHLHRPICKILYLKTEVQRKGSECWLDRRCMRARTVALFQYHLLVLFLLLSTALCVVSWLLRVEWSATAFDLFQFYGCFSASGFASRRR